MSRGQGMGKLRRKRIRGRWQYEGDWTDETGKRIRRVLSADRDTAQRIMLEEIRKRDRVKAGLAGEMGQDTPLAVLAGDYVRELRTRCTATHADMVDRQVALLSKKLRARQVRDLRPEAYERYRQGLLRAGKAPATVNSGLLALNGMLRWAVRTRRIAENPLETLRVLPTGRAHQVRPRRALTEREAEALLKAAYEADEAAAARSAAARTIGHGTKGASYAARLRQQRIPQGPLFRTLLETGARWGEARQLTWGDLDMQLGRLTLRPATTKNRRGRTLPLKPALVDELRALLALQHRALGRAPRKEDPLFLSPKGRVWREDSGNLRRLLRPILEAAGIEAKNSQGEHVDVHALRHTAATRLARAGWPMAKLQRFMGHQDSRTTQRYYDHLEVEDLEAALEEVPEVARLTAGQTEPELAAGTQPY